MTCQRCGVSIAMMGESLCEICKSIIPANGFQIMKDGERLAYLESQVKQLRDLIKDLEPLPVHLRLQDGKVHQVVILVVKSAPIAMGVLPSLTVLPTPAPETPDTPA